MGAGVSELLGDGVGVTGGVLMCWSVLLCTFWVFGLGLWLVR